MGDIDSQELCEGDAVNWDESGLTRYGFLEENVTRGSSPHRRVRVAALDRVVWLVEVRKLRKT